MGTDRDSLFKKLGISDSPGIPQAACPEGAENLETGLAESPVPRDAAGRAAYNELIRFAAKGGPPGRAW